MADRIKLIPQGHIRCANCKADLTTSILSSMMGTCVLGVPGWLLTDHLLAPLELPTTIGWLIGFSVCMAIGRLTFPLGTLVEVKLD